MACFVGAWSGVTGAMVRSVVPVQRIVTISRLTAMPLSVGVQCRIWGYICINGVESPSAGLMNLPEKENTQQGKECG